MIDVNNIDWSNIALQMHADGYAILPKFLSEQDCYSLCQLYHKQQFYRKVVSMERYRFGAGEYKYFNYPLPGLVQSIRENVYPHLVPIANLWMKVLNIDQQFPEHFTDLQKWCHQNNQYLPTPLILNYRQGGYNTLHQDLYGNAYFPMQLVFVLNKPNIDFTGGELVLTQQIPRAQSKAIVLQPEQGDMIVFSTNFLPQKGTKGYYRVTMKHGVSPVKSGERFAMGVIFHDANS